MYTFEAVVNKYLQLFFYFFFKFNRRSDLGPHALNRNTLTTKKKGAKPPRKTKVLGGFAPGTEWQDMKCNDSEKKSKKKLTRWMLKYKMSKNRSDLGTPTLLKNILLESEI